MSAKIDPEMLAYVGIESIPRAGDRPQTLKLRHKYRQVRERQNFLVAHVNHPGWAHWKSLVDREFDLVEQIWAARGNH